MRGKIKKLKAGFGFIASAGMKLDVFFHANDLRGVPFGSLRENLEVEFEIDKTGDRPKAVNVRVIQQESVDEQPRFLNPFNFVRLLGKPAAGNAEQRLIFGRCTPPPHDRYVGLSGRITCRVESKSPLFVTDSHGVITQDQHRTYSFFKYANEYAIPASSLRGMIRSVFESVTNSCLLHSHDESLDQRESRPPFRRLPYRNSIHGLLALHHAHLIPCTDAKKLCPGCRAFGWVCSVEKTDDHSDNSFEVLAIKSRISMSHGRLTKRPVSIHKDCPFMLAVLASPSPKTVLFYLHLLAGGKWNSNSIDQGYDNPNAILSGRKVYRRPCLDDLKKRNRGVGQQFKRLLYEFEKIDGVPAKDFQNRTVRDVLDAGNEFTFTIDYHNLAEIELGALLWAIELEKSWAHRLGYAKPLGFGDVALQIQSLEEFDMGSRYLSLESQSHKLESMQSAAGAETDTQSPLKIRVQALRKMFQEGMAAVYGASSFSELENVRDLQALLGPQAEDRKPMHYPRSDPQPDPEGKNFKWFMANKRFKHLPLPAAEKDGEGFPYFS